MLDQLPMSDRALEMIAHRFKLLSEPTRLRLLQLLLGGEKNVNELVEYIGTTQANISKHLGILCNGGLIVRRRAGTNTYYNIADDSLVQLCDIVCISLQIRGSADLEDLHTSDQETKE